MNPQNFGAYKVERELGAGALTNVFLARQEPLGRVVAIKTLKATIPPSSPFAVQLEREARVLADLSHPNVILIYDFVKTESAMYLVLEHVDGVSLSDFVQKKRLFSPEFAAAIGIEIASGLGAAHALGIVHRDVKPANVLVSQRGEVKLVDFGIAQRERLPSADEPLTRARTSEDGDEGAFGTPAYMSPEQILGDTVDGRSDLFSLGVVMYQLLAGERPFDRDDARPRTSRPSLSRLRHDKPTPLRELVPDVPRAIDRIVMRLLAKLPSDRFASSDELIEELDRFVRSRVRSTRRAIVKRALVDAGLGEKANAGNAPVVIAASEGARARVVTIAGFLAVTVIFLLSIAATLGRGAGVRRAANGEQALELTPANAGAIRVLATPWADVAIDGQYVDTTPIARAIPLRAGEHYLTFTHPNAKAEKRVVRVEPGENALVNVTMDLGEPVPASSR